MQARHGFEDAENGHPDAAGTSAKPSHASFPGDSVSGAHGGAGLVVAFRELSYSILKDGKDLDLITDISASFRPGRMAAIMGPSGAGVRAIYCVQQGGLILREGRHVIGCSGR